MLDENDTRDLIAYAPRQIGAETVQTVLGRDLHRALGVNKDYSDWVKAQIKRGRLLEHRDYEVFPLEGENSQRGRPGIEYAFSFDAAKHIGMFSNTAKGVEIREYFLLCERRLQAAQTTTVANPLYQQIIAVVHALDAHEQRLNAVEAKAEAAANTAAIALDAQQWLTIRQYVYKYRLDRQLPPRLASQYGRYLVRYCQGKGTPVYEKVSPTFGHENEYPENVIHQTLPRWLARHGAQLETI
jgi:phage anti-repressor protein